MKEGNNKIYKIKTSNTFRENCHLKHYEKDIYSQCGQDGVLEYLFKEILNLENITTFEVGGMDGISFSNTCHLIRNHNAKGIFVEASNDRYSELIKNHKKAISQGKVIAFNEFLTSTGRSSSSSFLKRSNILELDLISIDVDGMDYFILRDLDIKPKAILIEINATFHPDVEFVQPENPNIKWGSSTTATINLAKKKGYELIHYFNSDLLFLEKELVKKHSLKVINHKDVDYPCHAFIGSGYDGTIIMIGEGKFNGPFNPWEGGLNIRPTDFQPIPKFL